MKYFKILYVQVLIGIILGIVVGLLFPAFFQTGKRQSKVGRPTKKDKRDLDEFLDI
jgi:Na+/H+-dicarboxylate symporter